MLAPSNSFDAEGFLAVQSRDLVRVSVDTKEVYGLQRYATEIRAGFSRAKERALKRSSEMSFLTRTHSGALAHERESSNRQSCSPVASGVHAILGSR